MAPIGRDAHVCSAKTVSMKTSSQAKVVSPRFGFRKFILGHRDPFSVRSAGTNPLLQLIPLTVLSIVVVGEFLTPGIRITPSLLTIVLASLTLFLKPRAILIWTVILFIPVLLSLLVSPSGEIQERPVVIVLRCLAFIVVSGMAYGLSAAKENAGRQVTDLVALLDALRSPVVVSDVSGHIMYANLPLHELVGRDLEMMPKANFVDLFGPKEGRAAFLQEYLERFDGRNNESALLLETQDNHSFLAYCSVLNVGGEPYLVSQIAAAETL